MSYGLLIRPNGLQIMKNRSYDALTTPATDYSKFAFDSRSGNLAYAYGIGANPNGLSYRPMITSMARFEADWWDLQSFVKYAPSTGAGISHTTNYGRLFQDIAGGGSLGADVGYQFQANIRGVADTFRGATVMSPVETKYMLWQLPSDGSAVPFPSSTGNIGAVLIDPTRVRVPRAGYSEFNSDPTRFILHENMRPAKVVAAGRVSIPAGGASVVVTLPGTMPGSVFVGGQFSNPGHPVLIPHVDEAGYSYPTPERRVQVNIGSSSIRFRERNELAVVVSYYVVAEDSNGPSSGAGPVLYTGTEGGTSFARILKPGTTGSRFADILVDSRWQTMPLIASGFVGKASFSSPSGIAPLGNKSTATVSIPTLGFVPLVLVNWWFDTYDLSSTLRFRTVMEGRVTFGIESKSGNATSTARMFTGWSCYTKVQDGTLTFVNFFNNPTGWTTDDYTYASYQPRTLFTDFVGAHYHVFAVPQG